jgi:O-antigen/teichoic acid export membrane protein
VSVAAVVVVVTPWAVPLLFGSAFAAAIPAALVLVGAAAIAAVNMVLEEGLRGLGRPVAVLWAELAGLAVTVIALLYLLRPFGIMGAALASVMGYTVVLVTLVGASRVLTRYGTMALLRPGRAEIGQVLLASRRVLAKLFLRQDVAPATE